MGQKSNPISPRLGLTNFWKLEAFAIKESSVKQFLVYETIKNLLSKYNVFVINYKSNFIFNKLFLKLLICLKKKEKKIFKRWGQKKQVKIRKSLFLFSRNTIKLSILKKNKKKSNLKRNFLAKVVKLSKIFLIVENKFYQITKTRIVLSVYNVNLLVPTTNKKQNAIIFKNLIYLKKKLDLKSLVNVTTLSVQFRNLIPLSEYLTHSLEKDKRFYPVLNASIKILKSLFRYKIDILGVKMLVWGKLGRSDRTKKFKSKIGNIPTNTLKNEINYASSVAYTYKGVFGIKIWIVYNN